MKNCVLCESADLNHFEKSEKFLLCRVCDLRFLKSEFRLSKDQERERYLLHDNHVEDTEYQNFVQPLVSTIKQHVLKSELGLDYGCGSGPVASFMLKKEGYGINGYDPFFLNEPSQLELQYNYVFACEVAEHFFNPGEEFGKLSKLLGPGGRLFIKTELFKQALSFENWYYRRDPTHVCFYSEPTMKWIAQRFHFGTPKIFAQNVVLFSQNTFGGRHV
jgi:hypothetical protein